MEESRRAHRLCHHIGRNKKASPAALDHDEKEARHLNLVDVQSPCTEYNNTYEALKGSKSKGIDPLAYTIPEGHDPEDAQAAQDLVDADGIPVGIIYKDTSRATFDQKLSQTTGSKSMKTVEDFMGQYSI